MTLRSVDGASPLPAASHGDGLMTFDGCGMLMTSGARAKCGRRFLGC